MLCTLQIINNTSRHNKRAARVHLQCIPILFFTFSFGFSFLLTASKYFMCMASEMGFLKVLSSFFLCKSFPNEFYCWLNFFNPEMEECRVCFEIHFPEIDSGGGAVPRIKGSQLFKRKNFYTFALVKTNKLNWDILHEFQENFAHHTMTHVFRFWVKHFQVSATIKCLGYHLSIHCHSICFSFRRRSSISRYYTMRCLTGLFLTSCR